MLPPLPLHCQLHKTHEMKGSEAHLFSAAIFPSEFINTEPSQPFETKNKMLPNHHTFLI